MKNRTITPKDWITHSLFLLNQSSHLSPNFLFDPVTIIRGGLSRRTMLPQIRHELWLGLKHLNVRDHRRITQRHLNPP